MFDSKAHRLAAGVILLVLAHGAAAQSIQFTTSADPVTYGQTLTLSAQIVGSGGPFDPSNSFRFRNGGTLLCSVPTNASGGGSCPIQAGTDLPLGTHTLTVTYEPGGPPGPIVPSSSRPQTVVAPDVVLFPVQLPQLQLGAPVQTIIAVDPSTPGSYTYALTAGSVPAGVAYNAATSQLTGAPAAPGPYSFTITATDPSLGFTGSRSYSGTVLVPPTLSFTPASGTSTPVQVAASVNAQTFTSPIAIALNGGEAGSRRDLGCTLANTTDYAMRLEVNGNPVPTMPPSPVFFGDSVALRLGCNNSDPPSTVLTCTEGPLASPIQHTFNLRCTDDPVYGSDPRPTSAVAAYGAIGDFFASTTLSISNTGVGPLAISNCNIIPGGFGLSLDNNIPPGGTGTMTVDCTVPAPGNTTSASLSCNTNDPSRLIVLYKLFCVAPPLAASGSGAGSSPINRLASPAPDIGALLGSAAAAAEDVDGNEIVVVGAPAGGNDDEGRVYVYVRPRPGGQIARDRKSSDATLGRPTLTLRMPARAKAANGIGDKFGQSVAVSGDGQFIAVGAPFAGTGGSGSVLLFQRPSGTGWSDLATLTPLEITAPPSANVVPAGFGNKIEFAPDNALVVGAPNAAVGGLSNAGAAYHYDEGYADPPTTLVATTPSAQAQFGAALDIGNVLVVGAPGESNDTGAAYTIDPANVSSPPTRHTAPSGSFGDKWGSSVVASGATVVIGAPNDDTIAGNDSGSATVLLNLSGTALTPTATLVPPGGGTAGAGAALATNGDVVVIGAPMSTANGQMRRGRALVYDLDAAAFGITTQLATYENTIGGEGDEYGTSLALGPRRLVVGSPRSDEGQELDEGRADPYVLDRVFRGQFER